MVSLKVQVVTILSEDLWQSIAVQMVALSEVYGHHKQVLLKQHLKRQITRVSDSLWFFNNLNMIKYTLCPLYSHLQFGLCVFLLKNKHFSFSGQDVEGAPLSHHVNDILKRGTVGNELVVQVIDGQELFVWWRDLSATKPSPKLKMIVSVRGNTCKSILRLKHI